MRRVLCSPGSSVDASFPWLYTAEDWTPTTNTSQYVPSIRRFPATGYVLTYAAANGGTITSTGFAAVRASYLTAEPRAYNVYCWLYDQNQTYLGYSLAAYNNTNHSSTGFVTPNGEISIAQGATTGAAGVVNLSQVKYVRIINVDGGQFVLNGSLHYNYRSVSSLVPVGP